MKNVSLTRVKDDGLFRFSDDEKYSLSDRRINDKMVKKFTDLIRETRQLSIMFLMGNNNKISRPVWKTLVEEIMGHRSIYQIVFTKNVLCYDRAMVLAEVLHDNPHWGNVGKVLSFNSNLPTVVLVAIFNALHTNDIINRLQIHDSKLPIAKRMQYTEEDKIRIGQAIRGFLQSNTTVTTLSLGETDWGDIVATEMAIGLQSDTSKSRLHYCSNNLQIGGLTDICNKVLCNKNHQYITFLDLENNRIADDGAIIIAETLKYSNHILKTLYLSGNAITKQGFTVLADAIKYHPSLNVFVCKNNRNCTDIDTISLIDILQWNTKLRTLDITQHKKKIQEEKGIIYNKVTDVLEYNDTIMYINCSWSLSSVHKQILREKRTAPKKGGRIRSDIFLWLLTKWNQQDYNCLKEEHHNDSKTTILSPQTPTELNNTSILRKRKLEGE